MTSEPFSSALRRYQGFMADSARWERFTFRPANVVISTPSKCGTTWMQNIVGMLLLDRIDLGAPISTISPWLDMLIRNDDDVFGTLDGQTHRRFMKTHTPLDGVPRLGSVTYIAVVRHPLDIVMSDIDHHENMREDRAVELRVAASGPPTHDMGSVESPPEDPGDFLRWFIDNHEQPTGSGPYGLEDYSNQILTYWEARHAPNVHLFHYADMWNDLDGEMRRVAAALDVPVDEERWPQFVEAAGLKSMRSRAAHTAPEAHMGLWESPERFFRSGGTRDWASLLDPDDISHFPGAAAGARKGRGGLGPLGPGQPPGLLGPTRAGSISSPWRFECCWRRPSPRSMSSGKAGSEHNAACPGFVRNGCLRCHPHRRTVGSCGSADEEFNGDDNQALNEG